MECLYCGHTEPAPHRLEVGDGVRHRDTRWVGRVHFASANVLGVTPSRPHRRELRRETDAAGGRNVDGPWVLAPAEFPPMLGSRDAFSFRGDWFQAFSGRAFYPLDPDPYEIDIADIAHALARCCRFAGHVTRFYSVAEHSVHVSYEVADGMALEGLMHDASEAYIGDMIRPLKIAMDAYRAAEERLERMIAEVFGLRFPYYPDVKRADTALLMSERIALVKSPPFPWKERAEPSRQTIWALSPEEAERRFLARFRELTASTRRDDAGRVLL